MRKPRPKRFAHGMTIRVAEDDSAIFLEYNDFHKLHIETPAQGRCVAEWLERWAKWMEEK